MTWKLQTQMRFYCSYDLFNTLNVDQEWAYYLGWEIARVYKTNKNLERFFGQILITYISFRFYISFVAFLGYNFFITISDSWSNLNWHFNNILKCINFFPGLAIFAIKQINTNLFDHRSK